MMDFIWNESQAEQIRAQTEAAMKEQVSEMRDAAQRFETQAANLETAASELQSTLPIYKTIEETEERIDSQGNTTTVTRPRRVVNVTETQKAEKQIEALRQEAQKLRESAAEMNAQADELEQAIHKTNALFNKFFELSQNADATAAFKMLGVKAAIAAQKNKMQGIKDSFQTTFTTAINNLATFANNMAMSALQNPGGVAGEIAGFALMTALRLAGIIDVCASGFDPINFSTGNFYYTKEDISIPGRYPLSFTRFYNAIGGLDSTLGANWTHNYNIRLFNNGDEVHIVFDDGHVETYALMDDGNYASPLEHAKMLTVAKDSLDGLCDGNNGGNDSENNDNCNASATSNESNYTSNEGKYNDGNNDNFVNSNNIMDTCDNLEDQDLNNNNSYNTKSSSINRGFCLTLEDMQKYRFDDSGLLRYIEDTNGNKILLDYETIESETSVSDVLAPSNNNESSDDYSSILSDNHNISSSTHGATLLTKVSSPSGSLSFSYNNDGRIDTIADHTNRKVTFEYDQGQLIKATQPCGAAFQYEYVTHSENPDLVSICKITNPRGIDSLHNTYDEKGRTIVQHMADGGIAYLSYDDDLLTTAVTDQSGNKTHYIRDERYRTIKIIYQDQDSKPDCQESYEYDDYDNCISHTDRNNNTYKYTYDIFNNITSITDPMDNTASIQYNNHNKPTQITSPNGGIVSLAYDDNGNMTSITDPLGRQMGMVYSGSGNDNSYSDDNSGSNSNNSNGISNGNVNVNGLLTTLTLPDLSQNKVEYDDRGNIIAIITPVSNTNTDTNTTEAKTLLEYDNLNRVTKATTPEGHSTLYEYNTKGDISKITNPLGHTRTYDYNISGKVTKITDFDGSSIEYKYNNVGKIQEITDQAGGITKITYGLMWNVTSVTNPNGDTISYEYDHLNRVIKSVDEEGNKTEYKYDSNGNVTAVILPIAINVNATDTPTTTNQTTVQTDAEYVNIPLVAITHIKYDTLGRQKEIIQPDGSTTVLEYDKMGNITQITDAIGNITKREYDLANQLTKLTDPLGNATTFTYTALGKIEKITNAKGESKTHTYYPGGQLKSASLPCGETESYEYNKNGNVVKVTDTLNSTTTIQYDCLDRVIQTTNPLGYSKKFSYDTIGNITQMTDENDNVTQYKYSPLGDIIEVIDATGHSTKYDYDSMRRLTKLTQYRMIDDALAKTKGLALGSEQESDESLFEHQITTYKRNKKGEVVEATSPLGDMINYTYDPIGNLISKTDEDGLTTLYEYNLANKLSKIGYADGKTVELSYNPLKHLTQMKDWLGITTIETDPLGRATKITDHDDNQVSYAYNSIGQRESMTYPDGDKVEYGYNASGKLQSVSHFAKDSITPNVTKYIHDPMGRLSKRILPDNTKTKYEFNALDMLSSLVHSKDNGIADSNDVLDQFNYTYDPVGNITQIEKHRQGIEADSGVFKYTYDPLSRLTEVMHNRDLSVATGNVDGNADIRQYEYDNLGNRISSLINGITTKHKFNARNQLISTFDGQDETEYTYDKRGNLTNITQNNQLHQFFTFDTTGMMTSAFTQGKGSAEYIYNGFRKRVGKLESLQTEIETRIDKGLQIASKMAYTGITPNILGSTEEMKYVVDLTRPYDDLLMTSGASNQSFVWGNGLLSSHENNDNATENFHYLQDHLGSPIRLTGKNVFGSPLAYDEFGNQTTVPDMPSLWGAFTSQPFGFTGYQADNISGLQYAQARYYEPSVGRFTGEDLLKGHTSTPSTLLAYTYCLNNPLRYADMDGLAPFDALNILAQGYRGGHIQDEAVFPLILLETTITTIDPVTGRPRPGSLYTSIHQTAQVFASSGIDSMNFDESTIRLERPIPGSGSHADIMAISSLDRMEHIWEVKPIGASPRAQTTNYLRDLRLADIAVAPGTPLFQAQGDFTFVSIPGLEIMMHLNDHRAIPGGIVYTFSIDGRGVATAAVAYQVAKHWDDITNPQKNISPETVTANARSAQEMRTAHIVTTTAGTALLGVGLVGLTGTAVAGTTVANIARPVVALPAVGLLMPPEY